MNYQQLLNAHGINCPECGDRFIPEPGHKTGSFCSIECESDYEYRLNRLYEQFFGPSTGELS